MPAPRFGKHCYFSEGAVIVGDVEMGDDCTVWFNAVVRGDLFKFAENVGGNKHGATVFLRNIHEDFSHNSHTVGIKTVDRLVENEKCRIAEQCHSDTDTLLHTE